MALRKKTGKPRPKTKTRTKNKPTTRKPPVKHNGAAGTPWHRKTKPKAKLVPKSRPRTRVHK